MAPGPQLGRGTVAVYRQNDPNPIAYIASHYGPTGFREVIVSKKSMFSAPIPVNNFDFQAVPPNNGYNSPQQADNDFRALLGGGPPRNFDRWWLESAPVAPVGAFGNPPQNHSFNQVSGATLKSNGQNTSLWCVHTQPNGPRTLVTNLMIARTAGAGTPEIVPAQVTLFGTSVTGISTGAQFEQVAQSHLGAALQRYHTTETLLKLDDKTLPNNWNGSPK